MEWMGDEEHMSAPGRGENPKEIWTRRGCSHSRCYRFIIREMSPFIYSLPGTFPLKRNGDSYTDNKVPIEECLPYF